MPQGFKTIGQLATKFHKPVWKIRRIVDAIGVNIPRAGLYRLVPDELVEEIDKRLRNEPVSADPAR